MTENGPTNLHITYLRQCTQLSLFNRGHIETKIYVDNLIVKLTYLGAEKFETECSTFRPTSTGLDHTYLGQATGHLQCVVNTCRSRS